MFGALCNNIHFFYSFFSENDGSFNVGNITTLPVNTEELCSSPDVVQYYWNYGCHLTYATQTFEQETEENKCM